MIDFAAGDLLVASSTVDSPVLSRGVCLLVHQDNEAVIGVMLNRPMQTPVSVLAGLLQDGPPLGGDRDPAAASALTVASGSLSDAQAKHPLHFGGPLSGPLVAVHRCSSLGETETGEGIFVAAQREHLQQLIRDDDRPYRLIVGHLGWQPAQLQDEIRQGLWHVLPATVGAVFADDVDMWPGLIRRATAKSVASWIGIPDHFGSAWVN